MPLTIRFSTACWLFSWACCWASVWRSAKSSMVASTCPAVTRSPTLTATEVILPPLPNPRFCSVIAVNEPVEVTPEVTDGPGHPGGLRGGRLVTAAGDQQQRDQRADRDRRPTALHGRTEPG